MWWSIAPWNYPLQMAMWKMLPAVAAGNTIVLKPSELTPLTSLMVAEDATAAGMPDGVFNVITGTGPVAGEALIGHPDVRMISFTGSTLVGHRVAEVATAGLKRLHLELGGKAPFVVFEDADLEAAIQGAVAASLINTGQDCTAATRAYVHRSLYERFVDGVAAVMREVVLGDTSEESTDIGPLISTAQQEKVAAMVERAVADGAKIACGGSIPQSPGSFYTPTLVTDAAQDSEIVQEEVFGPSWSPCPSTTTRRPSVWPTTRRTAWPRRRGPPMWCAPPCQPGDPGRLCVDQRSHSDRVRDAPRRLQAIRLRQGHEHVLLRGVHPNQARQHGHHRTKPQGVAPHNFRRSAEVSTKVMPKPLPGDRSK